jgi:hypothetical protein
MQHIHTINSAYGRDWAALTILCTLICCALPAEAGMNKCVDAAGKISYSDQPCALTGQKPKEIQNKSLTETLTQENQATQDVRIVATCQHLATRLWECQSVNNTHFVNQCDKRGEKARIRIHAGTSLKDQKNAIASHFDQIERKKQALKNTPCEEVVPAMEKMLHSDLAP